MKKKLTDYDRLGSDEGCKGCVIEGKTGTDEIACVIDVQEYCGFTKSGGHYLIPAADAERHERLDAAKDAVVTAAENVGKVFHGHGIDDPMTAAQDIAITAMLDALEAVRDEG